MYKISEGAACSSLAAAYEAMGDRYIDTNIYIYIYIYMHTHSMICI